MSGLGLGVGLGVGRSKCELPPVPGEQEHVIIAPKRSGKSRFSIFSRTRKAASNAEIKTGRRKKTLSTRWKAKASLSRLLTLENWDQIRDLLNDPDIADVERCNWIADSTDFMGQTALHHALRAHGPLDIVCLIMDTSASCSAEQACEGSGRTALHVAAISGAGADIVAKLLSGSCTGSNSTAKMANLAKRIDFDGRTALHLACMSTETANATTSTIQIGKKKKKDLLDDFSENRREVVRVLLDAYPHAVTLADKAGKTPLDYVLEGCCGDGQLGLDLICAKRKIALKGKGGGANAIRSKTTHTSTRTSLHNSFHSIQTSSFSNFDKSKSKPRISLRSHDKSDALDSVPKVHVPVEDNVNNVTGNVDPVSVPVCKPGLWAVKAIEFLDDWDDDVSDITQPRGLDSKIVIKT